MSEHDFTSLIKERYVYDAESGQIFRKGGTAPIKRTRKGYIEMRVRHGGKEVYFRGHRVAWLLHYGEWPKLALDHINRNPLDNRIENLREATARQNMLNKDVNKKIPGVIGKFIFSARIFYKGKRHYYGPYATPEEAQQVYLEAMHHFDTLKKPPEDFAPSIPPMPKKQPRPKQPPKDIRKPVVRGDGVLYVSIAEAARQNSVSPIGIRRALSGKQRTSAGYSWAYA